MDLMNRLKITGGNPQAQSNPGGTPGGTPQPQSQGQQPGASQNGSQADYSAQWAEYYRNIGKVKEAEAIEAQMKAGKVKFVICPSQSFATAQFVCG